MMEGGLFYRYTPVDSSVCFERRWCGRVQLLTVVLDGWCCWNELNFEYRYVRDTDALYEVVLLPSISIFYVSEIPLIQTYIILNIIFNPAKK